MIMQTGRAGNFVTTERQSGVGRNRHKLFKEVKEIFNSVRREAKIKKYVGNNYRVQRTHLDFKLQ